MVSPLIKAALLTLFMISSSAVEAQEICSDKLLSPNIKTDMSDVRTRAYFRDAMCFLDYQKFVDTYGADTGGSYFVISGFGKFNNEKYREAKKMECRDITKEEAASSLSYSSEAIIPTEARALYVECVARQPLLCVFGHETSEPVLHISHHTDTDGPTKIRSVEASNNVTYDKTNLKNDSELPLGDTNVNVKVNGTEAARITINIKRAGAAAACTAFIAKALTPQPLARLVTFKITGTINGVQIAPANLSADKDNANWAIGYPGLSNYDIDVEQLVDGEHCDSGHLSAGNDSFPVKEPRLTFGWTPRWGHEFQGGAMYGPPRNAPSNTAPSNYQLQILLNPRDNCPK